MTIIKALLFLFCIGLLLGCVISLWWMLYAVVVNFYKIYLKKKPKKQCWHTSTTYHDGLYNFWKCDDCGANFPE